MKIVPVLMISPHALSRAALSCSLTDHKLIFRYFSVWAKVVKWTQYIKLSRESGGKHFCEDVACSDSNGPLLR